MREILSQEARLSFLVWLTNSLGPQNRASGMGKLVIMDYWILLWMVSLIQLEFFLTLAPSTEMSGYINSLLAWDSLNWHLSASSSGGSWAHWVVIPIQECCFGLFQILSLKVRSSPLGSQYSWFLPLPGTFPYETCCLSCLRIQLIYFLIYSVTSCLREKVVPGSKNPFRHVGGKKRGFTRNIWVPPRPKGS